MKIVQIISHANVIIGLGDDNKLYIWNNNLAEPTWSLY